MGRAADRVAVLASLVLVLAVLATGTALAAPEPGSTFPVFSADDVTGARHSITEYRADRVMIIAITDRGATGKMRAWWSAADGRIGNTVRRVSIVSIGVPFFVSADFARKKARSEVPRQYWSDTLLDTHHEMAHELGLDSDDAPWAFVLDGDGEVLAKAHAEVSSPEAQAIWRALGVHARR